MTTLMNSHTNGRKRPSLSEQINRLDGILDGLSDGLNDAVADAVKAAVGIAVQEAVQTVLKEVLANPGILSKLQPPAVPLATVAPPLPAPPMAAAAPRRSDWRQKVRSCAADVRASCQERWQRLRVYASGLWQKAVGPVTAMWTHREILWFFRSQILTAISIGLLMAILACYAEPWITTIISGLGGFVTTLAVQAGLWLRRLRSTSAKEMA